MPFGQALHELARSEDPPRQTLRPGLPEKQPEPLNE